MKLESLKDEQSIGENFEVQLNRNYEKHSGVKRGKSNSNTKPSTQKNSNCSISSSKSLRISVIFFLSLSL